MEPIDGVRLLSAFGTADAGFANLMLSGLINACCSKVPESEDVNDALAAVTGVDARDEIEGMLATQMIATHLAAITALRSAQGFGEHCSASQQRKFSGQALADIYGAA